MTFKPITNFLPSFRFHFCAKISRCFSLQLSHYSIALLVVNAPLWPRQLPFVTAKFDRTENVCFNLDFKSKNSVSDQIILTEQWSSLAAPTNWNLDIWSFIIFLTRFLVFAIDIVCCLLPKFVLKGYAGKNLTFIVPSLSTSSCINKSF